MDLAQATRRGRCKHVCDNRVSRHVSQAIEGWLWIVTTTDFMCREMMISVYSQATADYAAAAQGYSGRAEIECMPVFAQPETGSTMKAKLEEVQPVLMVRDVAASIGFFQRLGFELAFCYSTADPKYAGVRRDSVELHLQWHEAKDFSPGDRPTYRFVVPEVDELFAEFAAGGGELDRTDVRDTPWGTREFHVRDPDGNGLQFYRAV